MDLLIYLAAILALAILPWLAWHILMALGRLGGWLRVHKLRRRMDQNRVRYSLKRPQVGRRPIVVRRNGRRPLSSAPIPGRVSKRYGR